jgi:hypothetical protein
MRRSLADMIVVAVAFQYILILVNSARCHPPAAGHADLEAGSRAEMQIVPKESLRATGAHDQADREAGDHARTNGCIRTMRGEDDALGLMKDRPRPADGRTCPGYRCRERC